MTDTSLSSRMRRYTDVSNIRLMEREPVILWVDGKKFHTYTREMEKPFSEPVVKNMQNVALELCRSIEGVLLDENIYISGA